MLHFPSKSLSLKGLPSWSVNKNGPPIFGRPTRAAAVSIRFRSRTFPFSDWK